MFLHIAWDQTLALKACTISFTLEGSKVPSFFSSHFSALTHPRHSYCTFVLSLGTDPRLFCWWSKPCTTELQSQFLICCSWTLCWFFFLRQFSTDQDFRESCPWKTWSIKFQFLCAVKGSYRCIDRVHPHAKMFDNIKNVIRSITQLILYRWYKYRLT